MGLDWETIEIYLCQEIREKYNTITCQKEVRNASIKGIDICFFGAGRRSNIRETVIENTVSFALFKISQPLT